MNDDLPSLPPHRVVGAEHFTVTYRSQAQAVRRLLPMPLQPNAAAVVELHWRRVPDHTGLYDYDEVLVTVPCSFGEVDGDYLVRRFLCAEHPLAAGRKVWRIDRMHAWPRLKVYADTLTGLLRRADSTLAIATMAYRRDELAADCGDVAPTLSRPQFSLRLSQRLEAGHAEAQIVAHRPRDVTVHQAWCGPARLHLPERAGNPLADLPVRAVLGGRHVIADAALTYGQILHDFVQHLAA